MTESCVRDGSRARRRRRDGCAASRCPKAGDAARAFPTRDRGPAAPRAKHRGSRRVGSRGLPSREKSVRLLRFRVAEFCIKLCPDRKGSIFSPENSYLWNSARVRRACDWLYRATLIRARIRQTLRPRPGCA